MLSEGEKAKFLELVGSLGGLRAAAAAPRVPPEQWRRFELLLSPRRLDAGEHFLSAGEPASRFGLIRRGLLRFYYVDGRGRESTKAFRGPFEVAAAYAEMLLERPSRSFIQAVEACELLVADYGAFRRLLEGHPCWQEVGRLIAEQHYLAKEKREYELLQLPAAERYAAFLSEQPALAKRLPQYQIASYLGITPVALSRIVGALRRKRGPR